MVRACAAASMRYTFLEQLIVYFVSQIFLGRWEGKQFITNNAWINNNHLNSSEGEYPRVKVKLFLIPSRCWWCKGRLRLRALCRGSSF